MKLKIFFLVSEKLFFRIKEQTSKNVADTTMTFKKGFNFTSSYATDSNIQIAGRAESNVYIQTIATSMNAAIPM